MCKKIYPPLNKAWQGTGAAEIMNSGVKGSDLPGTRLMPCQRTRRRGREKRAGCKVEGNTTLMCSFLAALLSFLYIFSFLDHFFHVWLEKEKSDTSFMEESCRGISRYRDLSVIPEAVSRWKFNTHL